LSVGSVEDELLDLHDRFCEGFAERRADLVVGAVADTPELVVVTSEDSLVRGTGELRAFLTRYVAGPTTYSWTWERRDAMIADTWACLLAIGTEIASGKAGEQRTPYRMTLVAELQDDRWALVQVHGSSPHLV
jgi:hypothetical protein